MEHGAISRGIGRWLLRGLSSGVRSGFPRGWLSSRPNHNVRQRDIRSIVPRVTRVAHHGIICRVVRFLSAVLHHPVLRHGEQALRDVDLEMVSLAHGQLVRLDFVIVVAVTPGGVEALLTCTISSRLIVQPYPWHSDDVLRST